MGSENEQFYRVPNPNYSGESFLDQRRTQPVAADQGINAIWSPLERSGQWKVREFLFDKTMWMSPADCHEWVTEHRSEFAAMGVPITSVQCLEVQFAAQESSVPTEAEYEQIRRYALDPLPREDYYVRPMRLTNDQWSSSNYIKLSRGFQRSLIDDAKGKSVLVGHPEATGFGFPAEPIGLFFDAYEARDDAGTTWGVYKFFMPKTAQNEHARRMIDSGAWRHVSVGFMHDWAECSVCAHNIMDAEQCPHIPGESYPQADLSPDAHDWVQDPEDPDKVLCGMICRGRGQMLEGSIVYLPELRDTRIGLSIQQALQRGDVGQAKRMILSGDAATATSSTHEAALAMAAQGASGKPRGAANSTEEEVDPHMETQVKELETKLAASVALVTELEAKVAEATGKVEKTEAECNALKATADTFRAAEVADLVRIATLAKRDAELAAFQSTFGEDLATMPADRLLALKASWLDVVDATVPGGTRQSTPAERDPATGELEGEKPEGDPATFERRRAMPL